MIESSPNKPAAPNAGIALQFHSERHWPGVGEPGRWTNTHTMKAYIAIGFLALSAILFAGCAGNRELQRVDALRRQPDWPRIRAAAELEVARREGNTLWSHDAYYAPEQHTNGVWHVVASGAYPLNRLGDSIDMLVRDGGEVISYAPRMSGHPK